MKKLLIILNVFLIISSASSQIELNYTYKFDSIFNNIDLAKASTGVLYERVVPFAQLQHFNSQLNVNVDTINASIFFQGYFELYNAAFLNSAKLPYSTDSLKYIISSDSNIVDVGIVYYAFNTIDSLVARQKLYFDEDSVLCENKSITESLFEENFALLMSPLKDNIYCTTVHYRFSNACFFNNTHREISRLLVDFGDSRGFIEVNLNDTISITYSDTGMYIIHFIALFNDSTMLHAYSKINCKNHLSSTNIYPKEIIKINSTIPFQDYQNNEAKYGSGKLCVYYANGDRKLRKPILIVDGFDPQNTRSFESSDGGKESLWNMLAYEGKHLGDTLITHLGYDIVFLDYDNGGDYIERNAMVCIAAIDTLNKMLIQSGSNEQLVIVGPSMGGPVTHYALSYMEKHLYGYPYLRSHNCRLWIAFDSPQQGANISMGAQFLIKHFASVVHKVKYIKDSVLECSAAKQMLIIHEDQSAYSFYNKFYTDIDVLGYPSNARKISIVNGALNNYHNFSEGQLAFDCRFPYQLFNLQSRIWLCPTSFETAKVFDALYFILGIPMYFKKTYTNGPFCSIDISSGGEFNTFEQIGDNLHSYINSCNIMNHCFMPITSTLDLSGSYNYCTDFSTRDLVSEGITPFDSYKGLLDSSTYHATLNQDMVDYLINEIETYITGPREIQLCSQWPYTLHIPEDSVAEVTWLSSENIRIVPTNNPYMVYILPLSTNEGWISAEVSTLKYHKRLANYPIIISINEDNTLPVIDYHSIPQQNLVVGGEMLLPDTFSIDNGKTLTVSGTIHCAPSARIIVRPGGKLIVDGGTLTSACTDQLWEGICVEGNRNLSQSPQNQGVVILRNGAVIENARNAIRNAAPDEGWNSTGGIVYADSVTFRNNLRSVEFLSYADTLYGTTVRGYLSHFNHCNFIVDTDNVFSQNNVTFSSHVTLWDVNNVKFNGCMFRNNMPNSISNRGKAIYSEDAGLVLKTECNTPSNLIVSCQCPSQYATYNTFNGFSTAVEVATTGHQYGVTIDEAQFDNNGTALSINGNQCVSVTRCDFNLSTVPYSAMLPAGLVLNSSTGYQIEGNDFHRSAYNANAFAMGIVVNNSGNDNNGIYRNSFSNLNTAVYAQGTNGTSARPNSGLVLSCNEFTGNGNDLQLAQNATIHPIQGSASKGADNSFASTRNYSLYAPSGSYTYYHSSGFSPAGTQHFTVVGTATANGCASTLSTGGNIQQPDLPRTTTPSIDTYQAIRNVMCDTATNLESIGNWYASLQGISSRYAEAETQLQRGLDNTQILQNIVENYLTTTDERDEYDNYSAFDALKKTIADWPAANNSQIAELQRIADRNTGRSSEMAKEVLCFFFNICQEEAVYEQIPEQTRSQKMSNKVGTSKIIVYPNPSSNEIRIFSPDIEIRNLYIYDMFGKMLFLQPVSDYTSEMNLSSFAESIYLLKIELEDGNLEILKIVKN